MRNSKFFEKSWKFVKIEKIQGHSRSRILIHSGSFIINLFIYWIFHSINQQQAAGIGSTKLTMNNSNWKWRRLRFRKIFMVLGQSSWISGFDLILWCLSKIYSPYLKSKIRMIFLFRFFLPKFRMSQGLSTCQQFWIFSELPGPCLDSFLSFLGHTRFPFF